MKLRQQPLVAAIVVALLISAPLAQAKGGPASSMLKPGDCSTVTYEWSGFKKAASAVFELRPNGVYLDSVSVAPVGPTGSLVIPERLAHQVVSGEHYTVMAWLRDAGGRPIQPSPAAWWGYC